MAISNQLTMAELMRRTHNGKMVGIAEVLTRSNPIVQDIPLVQADSIDSHRITRRSYLPTGQWTRINQAITHTTTSTTQVTESLGTLEDITEIDTRLVDRAEDSNKFRSDETAGKLDGLSQTLAATIIYGNAGTDPEKFNGLAPRMGALDADGTIRGAGGTGSDLTSMYIIQWGPRLVHGIYPKGASGNVGITHKDLGIGVKEVSATSSYLVYRDHFKVSMGLAVWDMRAVGRLANIETTGTTNTWDEDTLIALMNEMKDMGQGAVIYCNSTIKTQMEIKAKDKGNVNYGTTNIFGEDCVTFRGHPVRHCQAILNTETAIS